MVDFDILYILASLVTRMPLSNFSTISFFLAVIAFFTFISFLNFFSSFLGAILIIISNYMMHWLKSCPQTHAHELRLKLTYTFLASQVFVYSHTAASIQFTTQNFVHKLNLKFIIMQAIHTVKLAVTQGSTVVTKNMVRRKHFENVLNIIIVEF